MTSSKSNLPKLLAIAVALLLISAPLNFVLAQQGAGGTVSGTPGSGAGGTVSGTPGSGVGGTVSGNPGSAAGGTVNPKATSQPTFTLVNPLQVNSIGGLIETFVEIFSYIAILIAVLMLIWVGFQYITAAAQGNSEKIKSLHSYLLWIVVGVAIVIGARVIVQITINTLSATHTVSQNVIQSANNALQGN
ncbi:MAG: hypothetical protein KGI66_00780 [Patescibacteria group bacterium]|nr:hypothetical protein [Patescibacteria group bacterium]